MGPVPSGSVAVGLTLPDPGAANTKTTGTQEKGNLSLGHTEANRGTCRTKGLGNYSPRDFTPPGDAGVRETLHNSARRSRLRAHQVEAVDIATRSSLITASDDVYGVSLSETLRP